MAVVVLVMQILACLGLGTLLLRALKVDGDLATAEHLGLAFACGFGILGWLVFPIGVWAGLADGWLWGLLAAGALGLLLFPRRPIQPLGRLDAVGWGLVVVLAVSMAFDLMEGLSPPADADSLAYQFNIPKQFIAQGRVRFIPRPLDGAVPLLIQMTYIPALALGGERALTLWAMVSGWAPAFLLFVLARRYLSLNWSLTLALVFLTTPAVVYGGGTGQVEVKMALFVLASTWAVVRAVETGRTAYAVAAGLGAGFYVGAKYMGLLFAAAAGLMVLWHRRWPALSIAFGLALLAAGFQWYAWNWLHTGDPLFPKFYQWIGRDGLAEWTKAHDLIYTEIFFRQERGVPRNLLWFFLYPFKATLDPLLVFDSGRVGLGPYGLLLLPFALLGAWKFRARLRRSPLLVVAAIAALYYTALFFTGPSQRVRHLVPVLPLFLICITAAAQRFTAGTPMGRPLIAAALLTIGLQISGQGLFSANNLEFVLTGEDRQSYLRRNVLKYEAAAWINANLAKTDRIVVNERQLFYYLDVPYFFASPFAQALVDVSAAVDDPRRLYRQLADQGITHLFLPVREEAGGGVYSAPYGLLDRAGCLEVMKEFELPVFASRTLSTLSGSRVKARILRLKAPSCLE